MFHRVTNYTDDKFPRLVTFYEGLRQGGSPLNDREVRFLRTKLERPLYDAAKNLFIVEDEHKIIALLDIVAEIRIKRVVLNCLVKPGHSYINLSNALLETGIERCLELEGEKIHVCLRENDHVGHEFFIADGYSGIRTFLELEADLLKREDSSIESGIVERASFLEGEENMLAALQNGIFSGSWGFCPNTDDEIKYYLSLTGIKLEGLGKKILRLSYDVLRNQGFRKVELTVDSKNKPACGLYASLGFKLKSSSFWFEKKL